MKTAMLKTSISQAPNNQFAASRGGYKRVGRRSVVTLATGNTFGNAFRVTTFGESHGGGVGCVVDGVPPRMQITQVRWVMSNCAVCVGVASDASLLGTPVLQAEIQYELDRRRPGQSKITTPRKETDTCEILSGMAPDGTTTLGTPICILVRNQDQKSQDYTEIELAYRPSHADASYDFKYGIRAVAGGGRSSARETIGRVAGGAIAKKLLHMVGGTEVLAYVNRVRDVECIIDPDLVTMEKIESNPVRCPDPDAADQMYKGNLE
jgi:chorismate synthase